MGDIQRTTTKVHQSDALDNLVRVGFVAYGVVHLLIGWLALQVAFGERGKTASGTGAMHTLAKQPLGEVLVWLVALGLFVLVIWRLVEAWQGEKDEHGDVKRGKQAAEVLKAILYAALGWSALQVAIGSGGSGSNTDGMTAKLMGMPAGPVIVGLVGLGIIGYGGFYCYRGLTDKFMENLDVRGSTGDTGTAFRMIGKVGHIAKGVAIGVVGALFVYAAFTHDPKKSGGLDQALQRVADAPFGQVLLVVIAIGIACYGVYCFARARYLSR